MIPTRFQELVGITSSVKRDSRKKSCQTASPAGKSSPADLRLPNVSEKMPTFGRGINPTPQATLLGNFITKREKIPLGRAAQLANVIEMVKNQSRLAK